MLKSPVSPKTAASSSLDEFRYQLNSSLCPSEYKITDRTNTFSVSLRTVQLGMLKVLKHEAHRGFRGNRRDLHQIQADGLDQFVVALPLGAPATISQSGKSSSVGAGSCILVTTSKPYDSFYSTDVHSGLMARIPGPLMRQYLHNIDECCAIPIAIQHGAGKILRSLIEDLVEERNDYSDSQAERFSTILLGTIANVVLEAPEVADLQYQSRQPAYAKIFQCAKDFIESNLSNSGLNPDLVAEHCQISTRNLYAAFARYSLSVGTFIREMRLQRCREALIDPSLGCQSIIQIAMRWGFNSSSSFNHIYRARFGKSPSEDRQTLILSHSGFLDTPSK